MIKIKIKYANGSEVSLELPFGQEAQISLPDTQSAVAPLAEEQTAFLEAAKAVSETLIEQASTDVAQSSEPSASASREKNIWEGEQEGEVGEGVVGGVGEEEGEVVREEEREPEKLCELHKFTFICENGALYAPPKSLCRDFVSAFGEEQVRRVFGIARAWLSANPTNRKTLRGMGRFLNSWLCRESGRERMAIRAAVNTAQGLLIDGNKTSQGW
jgi:hypothetical protein